MVSGIVEPGHRSDTRRFGLVVDEGTVTLGDKEHALDVLGCVAGEMILEVDHDRTMGQIAHPESMAGLARFPRRATRH